MRVCLSALMMLGASACMAPADDTVIRAAKVYTLTGAPLSPGMVHVRDGKVVDVGNSLSSPDGARQIDLGNGVLIPGLIDAHTSIGVEGGFAESTAEVTPNFRVLDAVDWSSRAFRHARAEGVTAVELVPGTDNVIGGLSCVIKTAGERVKRIVRPDHALVITLASDGRKA